MVGAFFLRYASGCTRKIGLSPWEVGLLQARAGPHLSVTNCGRIDRSDSSARGLTASALGKDDRIQLPPTLRGVRVRGIKPREVVAFQGWCVWCFRAGEGVDVAALDDRAASCAAASARAADARASSFSRQQCLYLRPEPQ